MVESLDTGAQGGKVDSSVVGRKDGNRGSMDKGSSYIWCERKGGRWLVEPLVSEVPGEQF